MFAAVLAEEETTAVVKKERTIDVRNPMKQMKEAVYLAPCIEVPR